VILRSAANTRFCSRWPRLTRMPGPVEVTGA
jgi:hypothetical protein